MTPTDTAANSPLSNQVTATHSDADAAALKALTTDPNALLLNQIITDTETPWQIHNCKIVSKDITQDEKLPFIYHYDALPEEVKALHPLTSELLKQFQTPMYASEAAALLNLPSTLIKTPWQVKVTGTLVMFCERLQIALRLKFTNTAKAHDPVYTQTQEKAIKATMQHWHFYGDVFVINKGSRPLVMSVDEDWLQIPRSEEYQALPRQYALAALALLESQKPSLPQLSEAIEQRLV